MAETSRYKLSSTIKRLGGRKGYSKGPKVLYTRGIRLILFFRYLK